MKVLRGLTAAMREAVVRPGTRQRLGTLEAGTLKVTNRGPLSRSPVLIAHQLPSELGPLGIRLGQLVPLNGDPHWVWLRAGVQLVSDLNAHLASRGHRRKSRQEIPSARRGRTCWPVS